MSILLDSEQVSIIRWSSKVQSMSTDSDLVMMTKAEMDSFARAICIAQIEKLRKEPVAWCAVNTQGEALLRWDADKKLGSLKWKPLVHIPTPQELAIEALVDTSHALGGYEQEES